MWAAVGPAPAPRPFVSVYLGQPPYSSRTLSIFVFSHLSSFLLYYLLFFLSLGPPAARIQSDSDPKWSFFLSFSLPSPVAMEDPKWSSLFSRFPSGAMDDPMWSAAALRCHQCCKKSEWSPSCKGSSLSRLLASWFPYAPCAALFFPLLSWAGPACTGDFSFALFFSSWIHWLCLCFHALSVAFTTSLGWASLRPVEEHLRGVWEDSVLGWLSCLALFNLQARVSSSDAVTWFSVSHRTFRPPGFLMLLVKI